MYNPTLIMKKLLITIGAITASFINAVHAGSGSVSLGYGTDAFNQGSILADESLSASVSYGTEVGGFGVEGSASTIDELSNGQSLYVFSGGVSKQLGELLDVYVGLQHEEIIDGASQLDAAIKVELDYHLSPYFLILRDTSDNNYVFEGGASHSFDLEFASLTLAGSLGNSDRYGIEDNDYYTLGASVSKNLSDSVEASVGYTRVDSDSIDSEDLLSAGLTFSF
jgi:hypothetical protein